MKIKELSDLEKEIMNFVWESNDCSVREVFKEINKSRKLAYTTIATILQRLHEKGLVVRRGKGTVFIYSPKLSKETYSKNLAKSFINKFFNSFGDTATASFADSLDNLPKKKRDHLLKLLDKYDKNQ